ncbi:PP2C family protein-serine/threonine phosphatase [Kitasatospora camelliae]|uniref:PP2C family protein-serine/threonine phosphatase n=1 Tax=Kitasatospora camelliae TaxID=3156397 RepID=A0AAU8K8X4_9ACTN
MSSPWPRYVRLAPWLLIVGGLVWDSLEPADYWGDPMLAAASVLAGSLFSLRETLAVGAASVAGVLVLTARDDSIGTRAGYLELANTLFAALLGVWVNRVIARHGRTLATVRSVAEAAQQAVLPAPPERLGQLSIAACYRAAQTEALIGGDAYAVVRTSLGVRMLIADVRGKGLQAVSVVSVLLGAFRENAHRAEDLPALAEGLEQALARESTDREEEVRMEGFVTALLVEFPPDQDVLRTLNRGHPGPYLLDGAGGGVRLLDAADPGLPLGLGDLSDLGGSRAMAEVRPFPPGTSLLLVTDGVTEARNAAGTFYDPVTRLAPLGPFEGPQQLIDAVVRDVERWTGGSRDDDMAILAVTRAADRPPAGRPGSGPGG